MFTDYLPKLIRIHKIIAESQLSLRIDFQPVSFLLKFGNRPFPLFKIVSYRVIINRTFPSSSPTSSNIRVWIKRKEMFICHDTYEAFSVVFIMMMKI